jgi:hypothetical protein
VVGCAFKHGWRAGGREDGRVGRWEGSRVCSKPSCSSSSPKYVVKSMAPNESRSSSSNLSDSGPFRLKCTAIEASSIPFSAGKRAKVQEDVQFSSHCSHQPNQMSRCASTHRSSKSGPPCTLTTYLSRLLLDPSCCRPCSSIMYHPSSMIHQGERY